MHVTGKTQAGRCPSQACAPKGLLMFPPVHCRACQSEVAPEHKHSWITPPAEQGR